MNSDQSVAAQRALEPVAPSEFHAVEGGAFDIFAPIGDRSDVGCGTMVLIDRMIKILTGRR